VDARRLSWGDWLAAAAGVVMLVALFLPWYSVNGQKVNAWQSMAFDDVILAVAAVLAIGASLAVGLRSLYAVSVAITSLAILPALIGLVVTVYRLISPAPAGDASLEIGAWLGLAAAIGMFAGAWEGATDEGPARRSPDTERRVAAQALADAELLTLPEDSAAGEPEPVQG
jgi:hypothetical protein